MNPCWKILVAVTSVGLNACALIPLPNESLAHKVSINGQTHFLTQITESTWTARAAGIDRMLEANEINTAALRLAIEQTSGCTVTDSDYSWQGKQFDAQVICESKLSN